MVARATGLGTTYVLATALTDAGALTDTVIKRLSSQIKNSALNSRAIVATAQVALSRFDHAANVSYAAFYA